MMKCVQKKKDDLLFIKWANTVYSLKAMIVIEIEVDPFLGVCAIKSVLLQYALASYYKRGRGSSHMWLNGKR